MPIVVRHDPQSGGQMLLTRIAQQAGQLQRQDKDRQFQLQLRQTRNAEQANAIQQALQIAEFRQRRTDSAYQRQRQEMMDQFGMASDERRLADMEARTGLSQRQFDHQKTVDRQKAKLAEKQRRIEEEQFYFRNDPYNSPTYVTAEAKIAEQRRRDETMLALAEEAEQSGDFDTAQRYRDKVYGIERDEGSVPKSIKVLESQYEASVKKVDQLRRVYENAVKAATSEITDDVDRNNPQFREAAIALDSAIREMQLAGNALQRSVSQQVGLGGNPVEFIRYSPQGNLTAENYEQEASKSFNAIAATIKSRNPELSQDAVMNATLTIMQQIGWQLAE